MKIAYLTSEYPAVSHTFILREVLALRKKGIDIETFSIRAPSSQDWMSPEDSTALSSTFYLLPLPKARFCYSHVCGFFRRPVRYLAVVLKASHHRPPGIKGALAAMGHFAEAIFLADELERRGIKHIHNHFGNAGGTVCYLASQYLGISWSFTIHGTSGLDYPAGLLLGDKIKSASFTACASQFVRAQAQRRVDPREWHKLLLTRCGVQLADLPLRDRESVPSPVRILSVGRLSPEKAFPGLIEAFARVKHRGLEADLSIIGNGPERPAIEQAIQRLGLGDCCRLLGRRSGPQVLQEMARSDIVVMSSLMEGLPVVLMEALSLEVPVIAPCVAGIPELVEHERTGLLYVVGDWDGLADCLARLISDSELRKRLGRDGRKKVEEGFAIDRVVGTIARLFSDMASRSSRSGA